MVGKDASAVASTKKVFKEGEEVVVEEQKDDKKKDKVKRRKSVLPMKKKVFEDDEEESSSSEDEKMVKNLKLGEGGAEDDAAIKAQMEAMRKEKEDKKRAEDEADGLFDSSSEDEKDLSVLTKK